MKTVFQLIEDNGLTLHGDIEHFAELVRGAERERTREMLEYLDMKAHPYHRYYKHAAVCLYGTVGEGELI